jgi:hypothetical protein
MKSVSSVFSGKVADDAVQNALDRVVELARGGDKSTGRNLAAKKHDSM